MMTYTTPEDIKNRYVGDWADTLVDDAQLQIFIDDLEAQAQYKIQNFDDNIIAGTPPVSLVKGVIANAIIEYIIASMTPYQSESQSNGEYSRSVSASERYRRKLVLTDEDLGRLQPVDNVDDGAPFMINLGSKGRHPKWETKWFPLNDYSEWNNHGRFL